MATTPQAPLTTEQKVLQTVTIQAAAASQIAAVWGHSSIANLIGEVPALAPVMIGFLDAIIAGISHGQQQAKVVSK